MPQTGAATSAPERVMTVRRYLDLARKAVRHPDRALLRLVLMARVRRSDRAHDRARLLHLVSLMWGVDGPALLSEYERSPFARWYRTRVRRLSANLGSARTGISDEFSLAALYLLVRAARPRIVVETGVLYGAASGHILAALEANGQGELHSVDLGCLPGEPSHDSLVYPEHAGRWRYHVGDAREVLPPLMAGLGPIDFFHHDSLHTFDHMTWEYEQAMAHLSPGGVLSSHDILVVDGLRGLFRENAFPRFCRERDLPHFTVRNLGVAFKRGGHQRLSGGTAPAVGERQSAERRSSGSAAGVLGTIAAMAVG